MNMKRLTASLRTIVNYWNYYSASIRRSSTLKTPRTVARLIIRFSLSVTISFTPTALPWTFRDVLPQWWYWVSEVWWSSIYPITASVVRMEKIWHTMTGFYIACSSEIYSDLRDRNFFPDSKFICILNGIGDDLTRNVKASRDELRHSYGVKTGEQAVLVLGRLDPQKAQLDVLEALTYVCSPIRQLKI